MRIFGDPSIGILDEDDFVFIGLSPLPFDLHYGVVVTGPYSTKATEVFLPGAIAAEGFIAGAVAAEGFLAGAVTAEGFIAGAVAAGSFVAGAEAGEAF